MVVVGRVRVRDPLAHSQERLHLSMLLRIQIMEYVHFHVAVLILNMRKGVRIDEDGRLDKVKLGET